MSDDNKHVNSQSVKIAALEVENLKRIKAVQIDCSGRALTVIGGRNGQGKTSVLDAIAYALGGERYRPTGPKREGSMVDPEIKLTLSNGLIVERKGAKSALKVTDPHGGKAGQQLLNEFVHQFALDLPKFMTANDKDKANALLQVIGVGAELEAFDRREKSLYDQRHALGVVVDQKKKYAKEMPYYADAPEDIKSVKELIAEQQAILAKNSANQRQRELVGSLEQRKSEAEDAVAEIKKQLMVAEDKLAKLTEEHKHARKLAGELTDQPTDAIEKRISEIEDTNAKARANMDKAKALEDAERGENEYAELSAQIEQVRSSRAALLDGADLPLPGLSVREGALIYNGQAWDCMSSAEQLIVATAIVRKLNPQCGFVLLDQLEKMDLDTLREFGVWLESVDLQAIATRVSTGGECSIIIEDGAAAEEAKAAPAKQFKLGEF